MRAGTREPDRRLSDRAGHTDALGADPGYTPRFQHNPLSDRYETCVCEAPYLLDELAYYVDLAGGLRQKEKKPPAAIGPNVETFDRLQRWAYVAVAEWRIGRYEAWCGVVQQHAQVIATDVTEASPK